MTDLATLKAAVQAAERVVENFKVGDEFKGAYGHAKDAGFHDDPLVRSVFTTVFLNAWDARGGQAGGPWDGPTIVTRINPVVRS